MHTSAVQALNRDGMKVPAGAKLVVIVVGDEAGEAGSSLAQCFRQLGYQPAAIALLFSGTSRGSTVRDCARDLGVPYSEVTVNQFDDPYHVPRVLRALLDAPVMPGAVAGLVERIMKTPLLEPPA